MPYKGIFCDSAGRKCSLCVAVGHMNALSVYWRYARMDDRDEGREDSRVGKKYESRRDENVREEGTTTELHIRQQSIVSV